MRARVILPVSFTGQTPRGWCRWCGEQIFKKNEQPDRRRNWHPRCVEVYLIATSGQSARRAVFKRDAGRCAACGLDCHALEGQVWQAWRNRDEAEVARLTALHPRLFVNRSYWQADHIEPVWKSHGELSFFLLENLQTLCLLCHKAKTKRDTADARARFSA